MPGTIPLEMDILWSVLMLLGSSVCHQISDRSYLLGDLQMPLCARCIGIQVGFLVAATYLCLRSRKTSPALPNRKALYVLLALFLVGFLDAVLFYSGLIDTDNVQRTISGLLMGFTPPFIILPLISRILFPWRMDRELLGSVIDWVCFSLLIVLTASAILLASLSPPVFYIVSVAGVVGIFAFFATVMTLLVSVLLDERRVHWKKKTAIAFILAIALISALTAIHNLFLPDI